MVPWARMRSLEDLRVGRRHSPAAEALVRPARRFWAGA